MANYQFKLTGDEIAKRLDKVTTLESSVSTMGSELQTVADEVDKHDSRLDTAEAAIKADEEKLESTINDVATNAKGIAENKTAIGTNATNIATNTANIATNKANIATNTANIATNTEAIKELQGADQELLEALVDHENRICDIEEKKTYSPIQVKIIGGKPKLINYIDYKKDGMVLLLYRSCRKQNRNRFAEENGDPRNPVTKGWNMMGRDNSVRLLKTSSVLGFNNREHERWHENNVTDANFECNASLLVEPHEDGNGNSIVSWGKRQVSLDDAKGKPRMLRFRFAVGYAKPFDTKTKTSDVYQLVSNLAEFSVVYSMSADGYYWKFSR